MALDQFRGYSVAAMFVVNFVAVLAAIHPTFSHHNTYFSYADSVMPSFLFICGFSFRLTFLKRLPQLGWARTSLGYARRSLALVLVSVVMYGFGGGFDSWQSVGEDGGQFVARLLKANLWEVLAIIGVTQLFILPWAATNTLSRVLAASVFAALHVVLSYSFNFDFVYGRDNWLNLYWGAAETRAWDGGFFGILAWAGVMLGGTVAYDLVRPVSLGRAVIRLVMIGVVLMVIGYTLSCLTRLYDMPSGSMVNRVAASPVWPDWTQLADREFPLLAEPPFFAPPTSRRLNYWMMGKRVASVSFIVFATGFAFATYAVFVAVCDMRGLSCGVFRTFGQNPLAAYVIHHMVLKAVRPLVPNDAPLWYCLLGLSIFFLITYVCVRALEQQRLFLRV